MEMNCATCSQPLTAWDRQVSKIVAYKFPLCVKCIAEEYDQNVDDLNEHMMWIKGKRPCLFQ